MKSKPRRGYAMSGEPLSTGVSAHLMCVSSCRGSIPAYRNRLYVSKQLNVVIHPTILADAELRYPKYSVISYFHVLEHIPDPAEELKIIKKISPC